MTHAARYITALLALPALAACADREGEARSAPPADSAAPQALAQPAAESHAWRSNPAANVSVTSSDGEVTVETGPHAVLWEEGGEELAPPYTVSATLEKRAGRIQEGVGLVFGGSGLEGPEGAQVYSYFLVRGDGSFLVKRRQGAETPVVRDWTAHPAIRRDGDDGGRPNRLEVRVGEGDVAFLVNGAEVARVPAADLSVRGRAGLRASHDVRLAVTDFRAAPETAAPAPSALSAPDSAQ